MKINNKVTVWKMSEEERLAYIKKNPIQKRQRPNNYRFDPYNQFQRVSGNDAMSK